MSNPMRPNGQMIRGRDLVSSADLSPEETHEVIRLAIGMKSIGIEEAGARPMLGESVALIFEKQSCRTRVTFEAGLVQLGAHPIFLTQADIGLGTRESIPDIARNLSRWVSGIVARTYAHKTVVDLAEYASVPVINALSDREHPCQALADFQTIIERAGSAPGFNLAYIGDGNNVLHSLLIVGAQLGVNICSATPAGYDPDPEIVSLAQNIAAVSGSKLSFTRDPFEAVRGAEAVYTDVWTSMGQEAERDQRLKVFAPYQVNARLMAEASGAFVLHCLPAHRGEEITDDVIDGPQSAVLDQAENRLWAQKALVAMTMANGDKA